MSSTPDPGANPHLIIDPPRMARGSFAAASMLALDSARPEFDALRPGHRELAHPGNFPEDDAICRPQAQRSGQDAAGKAKMEFLNIMSHELLTPLNGMMGMAQLLQMSELDEAQRAQADTIVSSGEALLNMINDILEYVHAADGGVVRSKTICRPHIILRELHADFSRAATAKHIAVRLHIADDMPEAVQLACGNLRKVLTILLANAIKYTKEGEVVVGAHVVRVAGSVANLVLTVRDSGIGMTPDVLKNLFQPFYQADASITRRHGGIGLGLALAKRIIDAMGGSISVTSSPAAGSSFVILAPCENA